MARARPSSRAVRSPSWALICAAATPTSRVLSKALCEEEDAEHALATAAEYAERYLGSREILLTQLRRAIEAQAAGDVPAPVHDLFSRIEKVPLVISATFGMELEKRLAERRRTALVAHVVRSYQAEHDGKMLVVRPGGAPSLAWADELDLRDAECVIYKPLGSPFLHDGLDPDLGIDTVVVTETDHAAFLARLENKRSGLPTAFSRPLQRRPIVFLGYSLDVWQYRLVLQVFESAGTRGRQASTFAVRQPASAMEELAWKRLGANLIPMDASEFATRALADAPAPGP